MPFELKPRNLSLIPLCAHHHHPLDLWPGSEIILHDSAWDATNPAITTWTTGDVDARASAG